MNAPPKTRNSLILRLRDRTDADAWREFVVIYEPIIYRVAASRGMQHADAMELVQRVLFSVAKAIHRFEPDEKGAKFRTWLYRIAHNEFCKQYAACRKDHASGDSAVREFLAEVPAHDEQDFLREYRRSVFRWAAARVRSQVKPSTWDAFWRTSVDGMSVKEVAHEIGISVGAVYIARSRVMARLQEAASSYEERS